MHVYMYNVYVPTCMFYKQSHGYISLHSKRLASLGAMNDINIVPIHFFLLLGSEKTDGWNASPS